jgi:hypothetical protein
MACRGTALLFFTLRLSYKLPVVTTTVLAVPLLNGTIITITTNSSCHSAVLFSYLGLSIFIKLLTIIINYTKILHVFQGEYKLIYRSDSNIKDESTLM